MSQGIVVTITDCTTGKAIPDANISWAITPANAVTPPSGDGGYPFTLLGGPLSGRFEIIIETGAQINVTATVNGNWNYYGSGITVTVSANQTFYNICLPPMLCFLTVTVIDSEFGTPIGASEIVSSNPALTFTMQQTGTWSAFFTPTSLPEQINVTVNGGEFYNSGNNFTQSIIITGLGATTMTIALSPATDIGSGKKCF